MKFETCNLLSRIWKKSQKCFIEYPNKFEGLEIAVRELNKSLQYYVLNI